ncbi:hypothetical protein D918_05602 [Trichuris suis]|nr:hypothetical protein D918_05602 [Trichuris suis]
MADLIENAIVLEEEGPDVYICTEECIEPVEQAAEANGEHSSSPPDMADLVEVDEVYNEAETAEEQIQEEETAEPELSEEEDDEDDVRITIGDVKTNINFPPPAMGPRGQLAPKFANKLDIDSTAVVNGASIYELDLTSLEEHPWREPGADLTDYFNYGFTEETWNAYCERQRRLRSEFGPENANRMFFNAIPSHYGAPGFDRNKGFTPGNISAITSLAPPVFPQIRNLVPVAPAEVCLEIVEVSVTGVMLQQTPAATADEAPVKDEPESSTCPPVPEQPEKARSPSVTTGVINGTPGAPITEVAGEPMPGVNPLPVPIRQGPPIPGLHVPPGFPPGALPPVPGLPMTNIPPPGMLPPFGHPPPGLPFPPSFQFPPPTRAMFPPRGYAGFRMPGREETAPSMGSYSGASSDEDARAQGYDHYGKHSDYEYRHGRSRSPGDSRSYSRHSDRRSRKHSRSPAHSRHRSRDERSRGSAQARSARDGHSHGHSEKRVSERKDESHDKEKSYRKKEDDGRKRGSKSRTGGRESRVKESRKSKERESKTEARESKAKERRSKREESGAREKKTEKGNDDSEGRSAKKRKKQKTSHHHVDSENDKPTS